MRANKLVIVFRCYELSAVNILNFILFKLVVYDLFEFRLIEDGQGKWKQTKGKYSTY